MIKPDGVHAVEQYVLAKYYLTTNVYRHRVRLITDQMIVRAIILGIEKDNIKKLEQLYQFDNTPAFAMAYRDWDDQRFMHEFGPRSKARKGAKCKELLTRLSERRLLKRVFSAKPDDFSPEAKDALLGVLKRDDDAQKQDEKHKRRRQIESAVAELLSTRTEQRIDPDLVIYHAFDIKSVKEMSRNDERSVLVSRAPQPRPFEEESALFRSIEEGYKDEFVEVYAPVEWDGPVARDRLCTELRGEIIAAIEYSLAS
jgi:hypothetical protein